MNMVDTLMIQSMKHNYCELVECYGYDKANESLEKLFGSLWNENKEMIWQWYDTDRKHTTIEHELAENDLMLQQQWHQSQCDEESL